MILVVKLLSGEELVGEVSQDNELSPLTIKQPCYLQMVPSRSNPEQASMALIPYAAYTENHSVTIKPESVVWKEKPVKELYNQYNSAFGSGIQLPGM